MTFTENNLGELVDVTTEQGKYMDERVVMVFCEVCGAKFVGSIREAGGFLGGHQMYHSWEFKVEMVKELEA